MLLPLEVISGYLEKLTQAIIDSILAPYRQEIPIAQNTTGNVTSNITKVLYKTDFQDPPDILKVRLNLFSVKPFTPVKIRFCVSRASQDLNRKAVYPACQSDDFRALINSSLLKIRFCVSRASQDLNRKAVYPACQSDDFRALINSSLLVGGKATSLVFEFMSDSKWTGYISSVIVFRLAV